MKAKTILLLLLAAAALSAVYVLVRNGSTPSPVARITRDGVLVEEINLNQVTKPYSFTLEDESGTNTVQVERGRIRVSGADCPDQICVGQGWISNVGLPIVCLPHRLMIEITGGGGELDGAAG